MKNDDENLWLYCQLCIGSSRKVLIVKDNPILMIVDLEKWLDCQNSVSRSAYMGFSTSNAEQKMAKCDWTVVCPINHILEAFV